MKIKQIPTIEGDEVVLISQIYTNTNIYQSTRDDTVYYVCVNDTVVAKLISKTAISVFAMNYYENDEE